ncbi:hypothetical protein GCM10026982_47200 [Nocardiopsis aegyptia]
MPEGHPGGSVLRVATGRRAALRTGSEPDRIRRHPSQKPNGFEQCLGSGKLGELLRTPGEFVRSEKRNGLYPDQLLRNRRFGGARNT